MSIIKGNPNRYGFNLRNTILCGLGFHLWDERSEAVKCYRCNASISWDDPMIKKIRYKRNSKREYKGKL